MLVAQNSLGPVCPVPLTVRGIDAAECVANALLQEQTQPTDELVQCARADEAAVRGADDVTERRADQRLPPLAAYVHPQRVRHAPTFGYDKFLRK